MPFDLKYGQVTTEYGNIAKDEPVVVFRAQDKLLPKVLGFYLAKCLEAGSPRKHLTTIQDALKLVRSWQEGHTTKVPD